METVAPFVGRGVLLDIPAVRGVECLEPGEPVTEADVRAAAESVGRSLADAELIAVRTGWSRHWHDPELFGGLRDGAPGPDLAAAQLLASHAPRAVGSDTVAFEHIPPGRGHALLPVHTLLLFERGIHIFEMLHLEELVADGVSEFTFVAAPLKLVGATGSPVRPLALVRREPL